MDLPAMLDSQTATTMTSPRTPGADTTGPSREATPSTGSNADALSSQEGSGSGSGGGGLRQGAEDGHGHGGDEVERLLKKLDMEKTMHTLQTRLELAWKKTEKGWTDMSIDQIETRLPPTTPQPPPRRPSLAISPSQPLPSTSSGAYEPPSPSRPWQLIDVLWQPLPPPSHQRYPHPPSPSSPRKRRADGPSESPRMNGHQRRASGSTYPALDARMASPLRHMREGVEKKRRSQSHSTHPAPTRQDVDAAQALTAMLGSGGNTPTRAGSFSGPSSSAGGSMQAPPLPSHPSSSLPLPASPSASRPSHLGHRRASSASSTSPSHPSRSPHNLGRLQTDTAMPVEDRADEDKDAAELMMFLAHSPSPVKTVKRMPAPVQSMSGTARVLFADAEGGGGEGDVSPLGSGAMVKQHSNLALAPPITPEVLEQRREIEAGEA